MGVTGWKLDRRERRALLERFPPAWPDVIADHVTLDDDADSDDVLPPDSRGSIVGHVDDGDGLQVLVVKFCCSTQRPDGGTFHITWSIDRARGWQPKDSNAEIHLIPARFP